MAIMTNAHTKGDEEQGEKAAIDQPTTAVETATSKAPSGTTSDGFTKNADHDTTTVATHKS